MTVTVQGYSNPAASASAQAPASIGSTAPAAGAPIGGVQPYVAPLPYPGPGSDPNCGANSCP